LSQLILKREVFLLPVILIIITNAIGFLLKNYGFDRSFTLLGFRFHLSLVLPFILVFIKKDYLSILKKYFVHPGDKNYLLAFSFIFFPALIISLLLFLFNSAAIGDPDYFYELGMTSILDYPVYLIWNLPQLLMLSSFLIISTHGKKYKQPLFFLILLSLFLYEFIPLEKSSLPILIDAGTYLLAAAVFSMFFSKVRNIYLFSISVFSTLWINILLFGSNSKLFVGLFLARTYDKWDGLLEVSKTFSPYTMLGQFALAFILFFIPFMLISRQNNRSSVNEYPLENVNK
jgi:hypothetical protein